MGNPLFLHKLTSIRKPNVSYSLHGFCGAMSAENGGFLRKATFYSGNL